MTRRWKIFGRGQVKRRIGQCPTREETLQLPKRKRAKTYCTIMAMNNLLRLHAKKDWTNYHIKCLDDGTYEPADPFTWEHFAAIIDADSCNVCTDHFLGYEKSMNITWDYDMSHIGKAAGRGAMKDTAMWKHQVLMVAGQNCVHGSTLSPPRMRQIQEMLTEYFNTADYRTDAIFQFYLPHLIKQLQPAVSSGDVDVDKVAKMENQH